MGKVKPKQYWSKRYWNGKVVENGEALRNSNVQLDVSEPHDETHIVRQLEKESSQIYRDKKEDHKSTNTIDIQNIHSDKLLPLRPKPTYNIGRDLNMPDLQITPLKCTNSHSYTTPEPVDDYQQRSPPISTTYPTRKPVEEYQTRNSILHAYPTIDPVDKYQLMNLHVTSNLPYIVNNPVSPSHNIDALRYVTNHLSNIEITRIHGQESPCVNILHESGTPEMLTYDTQCQQTLYQQPNRQVSDKLREISPKNKNIVRKKSTQARVKRGKPVIPEDVKDIFQTAGIDEQKASQVIVNSNIDNFRENVSRISDKPELKERLKEVRRQGKNRNAAKKSRKNMLERMRRLRETHRCLLDQLSYLKSAVKRNQIMTEKYRKYTKLHFEWQHYERDERVMNDQRAGLGGYQDGVP